MWNRLILGVALALIGAAGTVPPVRAEMDAEGCQGNACKELSGIWTEQGFRFFNEGTRPMRLNVQTGAEGRCGEAQTVELAPGETVDYGPQSFCGQVKAHYIGRRK